MQFFRTVIRKIRKYRSVAAFSSGVIAYQRQQYERAIALINKSMMINTEETSPYRYSILGKSFFALKRNEEAVKMLSKAYELYIDLGKFPSKVEAEEFKDFMTVYLQALKNSGMQDLVETCSKEASEFFKRAR